MIDSRILKSLQSRSTNPAYSVLITGFDTQTDCNQEKLIVHLHQINKSLEYIENLSGVSVISKDFVIKSDIDLKDETLACTLDGYTNYKGTVQPNTEAGLNALTSNFVEAVDVTLQNSITLNFQHKYTKMPHVILTIDSKYESYYSSYSTTFITDDDGLYSGVTVTFNRLKRKQVYPTINIAIIGDTIPVITTLTANNFVTTYSSHDKFYATLKDSDGRTIVGVKVKIVIGTKTQTATTNSVGRAYMDTHGLAVGNYTAHITFDGDDYYKSSSTTANVKVNQAN